MYDFFRDSYRPNPSLESKTVNYHRGSRQDFLRRHEQDVENHLLKGMTGVREMAPLLFDRIADSRTMRLAWDHLFQRGGSAPGPNGKTYRDFSSSEVWALCRCLEKSLVVGTYQPGPERIRKIAKQSGLGFRSLSIMNIEDRVVQRAIVLILQPLLDPLFSETTFGFRPRMGHLSALATAEVLAETQERFCWVTADIRDAFINVSIPRLLQVVQRILPDQKLLDLLETVLPSSKQRGIRQGGSLSPLMLNLHLHHLLDRPWQTRHPTIPLIRFADDILLLCKSKKEARRAFEDLHKLLIPTGMLLKEFVPDSIRNIRQSATIWMKLSIKRGEKKIGYSTIDESWTRLEQQLAMCHEKPLSSVCAARLIRNWLRSRAPTYHKTKRCLERLVSLAEQFAFDEIPSCEDLRADFQRSFARWGKLKKRISKKWGTNSV